MQSLASQHQPLHEAGVGAANAEASALDAKSKTLSFVNLALFVAAVAFGFGITGENGSLFGTLSAGSVGLLVLSYMGVGRLNSRMQRAEARAAAHGRHLARRSADFLTLPPSGKGALPGHAYASDLDLIGDNSLAQRIDVSHTARGQATLIDWLAFPAEVETIAARQRAVADLAARFELRVELEVAGAVVEGEKKIDPTPFLAFVKRAPSVTMPIVVAIHTGPILALALTIAASMQQVPAWAPFLVIAAQTALIFTAGKSAIDAFQLVAARRGYVEALQGMLALLEDESFDSELLRQLQERMKLAGKKPSAALARLDRWAGFAEFYRQFPFHFFVNVATFWDLHVLWRLESWVRDVRGDLEDAFVALAEVEALSSLAALHAADPAATLPEVVAEQAPLMAEALAHPLLPPEGRVENDLSMPGPPGLVIITGSNMAGKSTLLRSVGLNLALAYAGGPVTARSFRVGPMRLRASMRIDDSLQRGASYFHAELERLRTVVGDAAEEPPVFFLLDELLRGTNARARHLGARAVVGHLLDRGASGLVATHDIALSELEGERPDVRNVHFTDVLEDGEMTFDYRLRDGVVRTSNALRLLELAGIDLPAGTDLDALVISSEDAAG